MYTHILCDHHMMCDQFLCSKENFLDLHGIRSYDPKILIIDALPTKLLSQTEASRGWCSIMDRRV